MKKYILLLIIPLLFFNSCEEESNQENDTNSVSIIGTWVDNIDGGWIVTAENLSDSDGDGVTSHINYNGSVIDVIQLENINYSLVDGAYNTFYGTENDLLIFGDCGCKDPDDGMLGYQGANTFSTNDGGASRIIYNTWDPEQDEISYSFPYFDPNSNDACLKFKCGNQTSSVAINWPLEGSLTFLGPGTEYHEKLTFFDNGTYTYQVSPVIWKKNAGVKFQVLEMFWGKYQCNLTKLVPRVLILITKI